MMTDERYQQIMTNLGMPNSRSLLQALQQVANEVAQEERASERERKDAVLRYCRDVMGDGTVNEMIVARTVAHILGA